MQYKQTLLRLLLFVLPTSAFSQTTYLPLGSRENILLERLEIKAGKDSILNFSKTKPYSRRQFITHLAEIDSAQALSPVDAYNTRMALMKNLEWVPGDQTKYASKKPIWKNFYKTPATLYEVHAPNFFLAVDPVFQYIVAKESDNDQHLFLNTRGVTLRGRIADKIGFAAYVTDNQERDPLYVQEFEKERQAVPGVGFYKPFKDPGGFDYFDARGYITFNVAKVIDIAFGYDKNFIGNGQRSLFLSDFSNSALFLKLNTRIWKLNYQNLFMELQTNERQGADVLIPKKYAAMHHLDLGVTKWLNVGLFEGVIFGREDHFEFGYLNPVIFYRSIEQQNNSFDNAVAGLDLKANVAKHFQFYSQFLLDEFNMVEAKKGEGWWGNKWGLQVGGKYIDAFNIKNLDLQLETNIIRPFTYSHRDSIANFTHYNQPLAHPLGANLKELIGIVRYQPAPKWFLQAKAIYNKQGKDTGTTSFGGNIFYPNVPPYRKQDYGYFIGNGMPSNIALGSMLVSYELRPNLFLEANGLYRKQTAPPDTHLFARSSFTMSLGVRWNMHRREFDF
ncbi:hypothetical protein [Flavisolibacter tropicus]|uniref:Capsule assembly Wzi family protein n=1 Tax=Flavisolibacter tropicus TaxID=1492898 RepID=A0A172TUA0_9BACT|nr:hypothetical protein [Flavisolibacter tropicus]ANE50572.1 hypothetical protein SY85_08720 [Flavisolibacter tropicus]